MSYMPLLTRRGRNGETTVLPDRHSSALSKSPPSSGLNRARLLENGLNGRSHADPEHFPIIVHCHLCWDWVWQRPQQFLSRLSKRHKVLFVETVAPDPQLAAPLARFSK